MSLLDKLLSSTGSGNLTAEYLLHKADGQLTNSRTLAVGTGLSSVDLGAGSTFTIASVVPTPSWVGGAEAVPLSTGDGKVTWTAFGTLSTACSFVTMNVEAALSGERVLEAGGGITITDGTTKVTIASIIGTPTWEGAARAVPLSTGDSKAAWSTVDALLDQSFVVSATDTELPNANVLTAGTGISIETKDSKATISSTVSGGAGTGLSFVTTASEATLSNEAVLTAGAGISVTVADSKATIAATGGTGPGFATGAVHTNGSSAWTQQPLFTVLSGTGTINVTATTQRVIADNSTAAVTVRMPLVSTISAGWECEVEVLGPQKTYGDSFSVSVYSHASDSTVRWDGYSEMYNFRAKMSVDGTEYDATNYLDVTDYATSRHAYLQVRRYIIRWDGTFWRSTALLSPDFYNVVPS